MSADQRLPVLVERVKAEQQKLETLEARFVQVQESSLLAAPGDAGTQHVSAIDRAGGAVALTTTINTSFGSDLVVQDLGIVLNNQMDDFAVAPGVSNAFGLVGDEANAIAPGKRPLSSMTPTVVVGPDGEVVMVIGASGRAFLGRGTKARRPRMDSSLFAPGCRVTLRFNTLSAGGVRTFTVPAPLNFSCGPSARSSSMST